MLNVKEPIPYLPFCIWDKWIMAPIIAMRGRSLENLFLRRESSLKNIGGADSSPATLFSSDSLAKILKCRV